MSPCASGLFPFETRRKALMAVRKRRWESKNVDRYTVPFEPCIRCGHWHMQRSE